jgi:hypothetical protein
VRRIGATMSIEHTVTIDPDRLLDQILEVFIEYNNWLTFRQLASRLTGDQSNEDLIAGVVRRHSRVLIVNDGCRCKLRAVEDGDAVEFPR